MLPAGWPLLITHCRGERAAPSRVGVPTLERFSPEALRSTVITFRDTMKIHAAGINRLNVYPVPDGDTGTNMARTLDAVVAEMDAGRRTSWTPPAMPSATAA